MDDEGLAMLVFADIDIDGSGTLEAKELDMAARKLGVVLTQKQIDTAFAAMDADGNGDVDFQEFFVWFKELQKEGLHGRGGWAQVAAMRAAYYMERIKGNDEKARQLLAEMDSAEARQERHDERMKQLAAQKKLNKGGPEARREKLRQAQLRLLTGRADIDMEALSPGEPGTAPSLEHPRFGRVPGRRASPTRRAQLPGQGHCGHLSHSHTHSFRGSAATGGPLGRSPERPAEDAAIRDIAAELTRDAAIAADAELDGALASWADTSEQLESLRRVPAGTRLQPATVPRPQGWRAGAASTSLGGVVGARKIEAMLLIAAEQRAVAPENSSPLGGKSVRVEMQAEKLLLGAAVSQKSPRGERAALLSAGMAQMLEAESRATSPAIGLDKKRGNPYLRHGGSVIVGSGTRKDPEVTINHAQRSDSPPREIKDEATLEAEASQRVRLKKGRESAAWADRTRAGLIAAGPGAVHVGKSYRA